jgi:hypothetical protein
VPADEPSRAEPIASSEATGPCEASAFSWHPPPDLSPGSTCYQERIRNLRLAADTLPDPELAYQQGIEDLRIHRNNYDAEGPRPRELRLLWWEFPPEHWEAMREGSQMNFLVEPEACIHENANMDEEQLRVAAKFVDKLIKLKILRPKDSKFMILSTMAPIFAVPKEGQKDQWRVIADMLRGGQNACVGSDPVFLPRVPHIVTQLFTGGFSAVVDASKLFYQFCVHPDNQPYLGLLHPLSGLLYAYQGCPMGAGNCPAVAGRCGLAFVRMLREKFSEFQGSRRMNSWWTGFQEVGYDPEKGYGFILESSDGLAVLVWAFVDDFLIHGPTKEKTERALSLFMDLALDCGLLCHPKKCTLPPQVVRYCGFLIDTRGVPCVRIPIEKTRTLYCDDRSSLKLSSRKNLLTIKPGRGGWNSSIIGRCNPSLVGKHLPSTVL